MDFKFSEAADVHENTGEDKESISAEIKKKFDDMMGDNDLPEHAAYSDPAPDLEKRGGQSGRDGLRGSDTEPGGGKANEADGSADAGRIPERQEENPRGEQTDGADTASAEENADRAGSASAEENVDVAGSGSAEENADAVEQKEADETPERGIASGCPIEGHNGHWEGERGNSKWIPDDDSVPARYNPNPYKLSWKEIKDKYDIDGIEYKDGQPDFSGIAKGEVKIDDFTDDRASNFAQADERLASQRGCSPEEVKEWRQENRYTWHECRDCETMQKVPQEVHNNMDHSGGVSEYKRTNGGN